MIDNNAKKELKDYAKELSVAVLVLLGLKRSNKRIEYDELSATFKLDGRTISPETMRRLLADVEAVGGQRIARNTTAFLDGKIELEIWRARMKNTITAAHVIAGALALGALLKAMESPLVNRRIASDLKYLQGFTNDLKAGKVSPARAVTRGKSYLRSATHTYFVTEQDEKGNPTEILTELEIGGVKVKQVVYSTRFKEARRIRTASESCVGCFAWADKWLPIAEMPPIGSLDCGGFCKCFLEYR